MAPADVNSDDYYRVLGVERNAADADIAKAYKKLALKHHPDKNPHQKEQAEEIFKKITEAYDVLRSAEKRRIYDQVGKQGLGGGVPADAGAAGFGGMPSGGFGGGGMTRNQADEIFRMFFSGSDPFAAFAGGVPGGRNFMFQSGPGSGSSSQFQFQSSMDDDDGDGVPMVFGPAGFFSNRGRMRARTTGAGKRSRAASSGVPRDRPLFYAMPVGTAVTVCGLEQAQEHNGRIGRVSGFDPADGRYTVNFEHPDGRLSVKPKNLTQMCRVLLTGLEGKPELNGRGAEIIGYDSAKNRYMVLLEGPNSVAISVQLGNCILPIETRVILQGLGHAAYNGQMAQILSLDREARRYTVLCQGGNQIKVKYDNVRC